VHVIQFFLEEKVLGTFSERSHDTALRDIQYLIDKGVLVKEAGGGRSTSYSLQSSGSFDSDGTQ
jgi:predicted HTH transcriptional regulator